MDSRSSPKLDNRSAAVAARLKRPSRDARRFAPFPRLVREHADVPPAAPRRDGMAAADQTEWDERWDGLS